MEDGTYTYEWNAADQLIAIYKKGETSPYAEYKYDDDGRRIQKNVKGTITNYIYDGDSLNVLYETNTSDQVLRSYVYGVDGQLLAFNKYSGTSVSATYYYHYNPRGNVFALTDKSGNLVASYSYDSWGNPLESKRTGIALENPFRYAGYQFDEETGLFFLMARYYHPTHGVFVSLDPDPGDDDDILTQNGYNYVGNNPIMMVDPDGRWFWLAVNAGMGAYAGYKAYKSGKGWKGVAGAAAMSAIGVGKIKAAKKATHAVYTLTKKGKVVYVGRTKNINARKYAHSKVHSDADFNVVKKGLNYNQGRGLEHRLYLKNGGKKNLRNKIRPISKKNKKIKK
ncbi:RHS repeat domain-containing protein [Peribacillus aracenensis]|uniref:RHS repeat domain-containing protein n=1 Tax=Peribacillus aracenensis TaxID=2976708 RepID=UPI002882DE9F|nr:RHS repeat-associated core domain-containing protein [Peribacillus sp. BBB004]